MRRGFGIVGLVATVILLGIVGVVAYNIGWSDGVNTHLPAATSGAPPYYYYGPHFWGAGFGFFGILWFLLIVFGIFWFFRLLFWGFMGRRMWMGGWGYGRGRGWGYPGQSFEDRAQEWHRRQHGEQPPSGAGTPPPPPPPPPPPAPPDTRSV